jgi:hypothetical protein
MNHRAFKLVAAAAAALLIGSALAEPVEPPAGSDRTVKVLFFMKRANHLTLEEFRTWWFETHMPDIRKRHGPYLVGYRLNIRSREKDDLAGRPKEDPQWDGVAELWYRDEAALNSAYSGAAAEGSRQDTLAHVSRLERLIVDQRTIIDPNDH